ncbi:type II toxin-antitoxin system Phd/YefM family antitoxin [Thiohalospira sp.]|uniref:type II toxin-antitoxin system Phd/YefM family antitoxin n=1 Tax=Thiohalospira sp. TaxID=3080549 RepID=UPI00397F444A
MNVSVRELKAHLSEYLRRAQAGETIVITSRNNVVGRLSAPTEEDHAPAREETAALERLRAQPWLQGPSAAGAPGGTRPRIAAREGETLSTELLERD